MADISTCLSPVCNCTVEGTVKKCPECGWAMRSSRNIRMRGVALLICGLVLVGMMGTILWNIGGSLRHPGEEVNGSTFNAKPEDARMIMMLFWAIIAFGAAALASGTYQIVSGRKSRAMTLGSLLLAAIVLGIAWFSYNRFK